MGLYTININMSYRKDIMAIYEGLTTVTQKIYKLSTLYLLKKGILNLPPHVTIPKTAEVIHDPSFMKGFNPFGDKRALTTIELGCIHHGIETNNIGLQLITGFAQVAKKKEVKQFFVKGMDLAKKEIQTFEEILLEANIHFSASAGSTVITSTVAPFSEKLMMNCIFLLNGFGLVGASFATIFSLRNDIAMKTILLAKDVFSYSHEGVKIMMKHGWLEEPPQMEDRLRIINNH